MANKDKPQASREREGAAPGGAEGLKGGSAGITSRPPHIDYRWGPVLHTHSCPPTSRRVHLDEDSEVNDAGGEVEGCLLAAVDHRDAVAVPVAGPRHAALEDGEGQPGRHRRAGVGWGSPHG